MRWSDLLATSLASLRQRAFRTSLTVLGVLIGTTAVIVMVSLGVGMSSSFDDQFDTNSLRQVTMYGPPPDAATNGMPDKLNEAMVAQMAQYPGVLGAWPIYSVDAQVRVAGHDGYMSVTGMPAEAMAALDLPLAWGSLPERGAPLAFVVGDQVSMMFWNEQTGMPAEIDFSRDTVFVVWGSGMGAGDPYGPPQPVPTDPNPDETPDAPPKRVIVPVSAQISDEGQGWTPYSTMVFADIDALIKALEKAMPGKALPNQPATPSGGPVKGFIYNEIRLQTADAAAAEALLLDLREQGYQVAAEIEWIRQAQQQGLIIQAVFGGIGFISLLVAAIGIANTMLMSVYERTKEIGIMKVLGAALGDIRKMFLIESASIGLFGGVAGLLLSLAVSGLLNATLGAAFMGGAGKLSVIPVWLALGAVLFSTLIGTVAGMAPAQRATKLSPLAAIRGE